MKNKEIMVTIHVVNNGYTVSPAGFAHHFPRWVYPTKKKLAKGLKKILAKSREGIMDAKEKVS